MVGIVVLSSTPSEQRKEGLTTIPERHSMEDQLREAGFSLDSPKNTLRQIIWFRISLSLATKASLSVPPTQEAHPRLLRGGALDLETSNLGF